MMGALGEIFAPLIPALICGGLILGFRNIIGEINFFENGTKSLADMYQFWEGTYNFLWLIGEAVFHLLPVGIVWSITKKMGTTQILGIILGLTLVSSQLLNGFSVADTPTADIPVWDFGFTKVEMIGYQGQVIAAMMAGFVLVYLEKFFKKHCPEVISMIVVPFCSLVPAVIIRTYRGRTDRLDHRKRHCGCCLWWTDVQLRMVVCWAVRTALCADCYDRASSHDECH